MATPDTLLVVEDDDALRYTLVHALGRAGYRTLEARSGSEALALVQSRRPELVLLDVGLPDVSGVEVCRRIKSDPALGRTFVVHLSGVATSHDSQADALEAGADSYVTKPVHERALLANLRAVLRMGRAEAALVNQQERELRALGGAPPGTEAGAAAPEPLVAIYRGLLEDAVLRRAYKTKGEAKVTVPELAERAHARRWGPREIVEVHLAALQALVAKAPPEKMAIYVEEARLLLIELMGHLLERYRQAP